MSRNCCAQPPLRAICFTLSRHTSSQFFRASVFMFVERSGLYGHSHAIVFHDIDSVVMGTSERYRAMQGGFASKLTKWSHNQICDAVTQEEQQQGTLYSPLHHSVVEHGMHLDQPSPPVTSEGHDSSHRFAFFGEHSRLLQLSYPNPKSAVCSASAGLGTLHKHPSPAGPALLDAAQEG